MPKATDAYDAYLVSKGFRPNDHGQYMCDTGYKMFDLKKFIVDLHVIGHVNIDLQPFSKEEPK